VYFRFSIKENLGQQQKKLKKIFCFRVARAPKKNNKIDGERKKKSPRPRFSKRPAKERNKNVLVLWLKIKISSANKAT
jgi:hypothetical protein